jgi:division protein CdvB (Snf7/Vps24/ESCRT-III family)
MNNSASNNPANPPKSTPASAAESKQIILKEIGVKWDKFSEQELTALKTKDDLVTQIVAKYSLDKAQAQRDVDALMRGRSF